MKLGQRDTYPRVFRLSLSLFVWREFHEDFSRISPLGHLRAIVFGRAILCGKEREFWSERGSVSIGNFSPTFEFLWSAALFSHLLDQSRIPLFAFRFLEDSGFWNFAEEKGQTLFSSFDRCWDSPKDSSIWLRNLAPPAVSGMFSFWRD
jgi:hypothetical protein